MWHNQREMGVEDGSHARTSIHDLGKADPMHVSIGSDRIPAMISSGAVPM